MAAATIHPTHPINPINPTNPTHPIGPALPRSVGRRGRAASRPPSRRGADVALPLDALPVAALVVDATGGVLLANSRARRLLSRSDGLRIEGGHLTAATAGDTRRLQDAIVRAATATGEVDPGTEELSIATNAPGSLRLRFWAGDPEEDPAVMLRRVWILIEGESPQREATVHLLAALTPRERDVLRHLVVGDGAKEIAWSLGLSVHTVAGYVKALHRRLGARSRGELLARFIAPCVLEALDLAAAGAATPESAGVSQAAPRRRRSGVGSEPGL